METIESTRPRKRLLIFIKMDLRFCKLMFLCRCTFIYEEQLRFWRLVFPSFCL
jgi:hypothetical protein